MGIVWKPVVGIRKHTSNVSGNPMRTALAELEILRYVLDHHPAARLHAGVIREQIVRISAGTAENAFALGEFAKMRDLLKDVPWNRRSRKLHIKSLLAYCPAKVTTAFCKSVRSGRHSKPAGA